jgi:hypothetical protein
VVSGYVFGIVIFIIVESHPLWATARPRQGHAKQVKARALEHAQHDGAAAAGRRRYVKAFAQRDECSTHPAGSIAGSDFGVAERLLRRRPRRPRRRQCYAAHAQAQRLNFGGQVC